MRLFISFGFLFIVLLLSQDVEARSIQNLKTQIEKRLSAEQGLYAIAFKDLVTGDTLFINEREMMHAASTMKVAVMIEVFRQADLGRFGLDDSVKIVNQFTSLINDQPFSIDVDQDSHDPVVQAIGRQMTVRQLIFHMITVSSNLATNLLMQRVGAENIQSAVRMMGTKQMQILRGVEDNAAYEKGLNNRTDAYDLMILLDAIAAHKIVSTPACEEMISILLQQAYRDKIPARLPLDVRVAHKTGSITKINHDAAIVFLPDGRKYVLVILSQGVQEHAKSSEVIADLSFSVYEWIRSKK
ncbi:serine hydrolase [candidate division KSB1 bacterium]|nr:serine hydrolase [candidate division KSB1 bacterium]